MTRPTPTLWLHRFAVFTAAATLCLIWVGGLVTSHGAGMAVPDWPTSYGYNMFYFPIGKWVGGIFYEHTHRLLAAGVGLLTSILAAWNWGRETTGRARWLGWIAIGVLVGMLSHRGSPRAPAGGIENVPMHFKVLAAVLPVLLAFGVGQIVRTRGSLRWLAMTAFFAVIFQGILGGFRVANMQDALGIFHATLAQLFLVLLSGIALVTSRWWSSGDLRAGGAPTSSLSPRGTSGERGNSQTEPPSSPRPSPPSEGGEGVGRPKLPVYGAGRLRYLFPLVTGLVLTQLILGASMRHQHAGLAIPDFPFAYGKLWPATDEVSIARYNQNRVELNAANPITAGQVVLQMVHRGTALLLFAGVAWLAGAARRRFGAGSPVARVSAFWLGLVLLQAVLGAATIWTGKAADIATLHVAMGAIVLVTGGLLSMITFRASGVAAGQGSRRQLTSATGLDFEAVRA